eukprot:scaffold2735_cov175-Cylindrotheca_fusiformis.AAC.2
MSETTWAVSTNDWVRSLENGADEEVESNCYCPLGKEVIKAQISLGDVIPILQGKIDDAGIPAAIDGAIEVTVSQCPVEVNSFASEISYTFYVLVEDVDAGIAQFGPELANAYNTAADSLCDPLYRRGIVLTDGRLASSVPT